MTAGLLRTPASRHVSIYQRILGHPFVYHHVRPLVVGIDYTMQYEALGVGPGDVVLDIGCGGGDALRYLGTFGAYHGYDTDPVAISFAQRRPEAQRPDVHFTAALVDQATLDALAPTRVMMNGLLHHLADADAAAVLRMCCLGASVERVVTNDVVYLDRRPLNNLIARLDRGRFVRTVDGYRDIAVRAGLRIERLECVRSHPRRGIVEYLVMVLRPHDRTTR